MFKYLNPLSRALIALIFVVSGLMKVTNFQGSVGYAAAEGLPAAQVAIALAILFEVGGGLALLFGWHQRWASLALFLFLIPTTLIFHASHLGDPAQAQMQMANVLKNIAIMGGLLKFFVDATPEAASTAVPVHVEHIRRAS